MLYHLAVAVLGIAALLILWTGVERLARSRGSKVCGEPGKEGCGCCAAKETCAKDPI